ncbi:zona pellucida sperm-binding protein 4-like [Acanthochromis polyacanthus]|uniref:zona pellucida sperm-binding protein 4-like n=1 Tax=Acanthochromis polyacanthus TaxID=80966 RepID=UPI00223419CB|nr:zona pellucida sperm-binding protein 4-like [Acanthochromis polyacanthus]
MGCCFNKHPPACYYPMDECTIDRHFVFSVPAALTEPPLSPTMLVAASNSTCKPERVTSNYALFKIPMDGCGTRRVVVGKTVVYMVEVINKVQTISLNYGTITRDSPVRLLVECRFMPGALLTVSYVVKSPSLGPEIHTQGCLVSSSGFPKMPITAATTHSITSPCRCCWGNLSIWKYGSSTLQIPV